MIDGRRSRVIPLFVIAAAARTSRLNAEAQPSLDGDSASFGLARAKDAKKKYIL